MEQTNELTVTRALAELTTLKKRIGKLTSQTTFISTKVSGQSWKDHIQSAKSAYQSIRDLTTRYSSIKFAILRSNGSVKVTIGGNVYTVAEAIATKECLEHDRVLLQALRHQRATVTEQVERHERSVRASLDKLLETNFKSDKSDPAAIQAISESYLKNNKIEVVDPLNLDLKIEELDDRIESFASEVDFSLSESNATTRVTLTGAPCPRASSRGSTTQRVPPLDEFGAPVGPL